MKKLLLSIAVISIITFGCSTKADTTLCKEHVKNCPVSENCPEHPECEAHENCEKGKTCTHINCMAFDKEKG